MLPPTAYTSKYIHTAELFQRNIGLITLFFNTETLEQTPLSLKQIHWLRRECAWCYATFMLNSGVSLKKRTADKLMELQAYSHPIYVNCSKKFLQLSLQRAMPSISRVVDQYTDRSHLASMQVLCNGA